MLKKPVPVPLTIEEEELINKLSLLNMSNVLKLQTYYDELISKAVYTHDYFL
jgi:hypothetical protein